MKFALQGYVYYKKLSNSQRTRARVFEIVFTLKRSFVLRVGLFSSSLKDKNL